MIRCYLCPIQDHCEVREKRESEYSACSSEAVILPGWRSDECPLCKIINKKKAKEGRWQKL